MFSMIWFLILDETSAQFTSSDRRFKKVSLTNITLFFMFIFFAAGCTTTQKGASIGTVGGVTEWAASLDINQAKGRKVPQLAVLSGP